MKSGFLGIACAALSVTLAVQPASAATNLFVNGGFEDGNFTGWTVSNNPAVTGSAHGVAPEEGSYQASFQQSGHIAQTFTDTAGEQLALSFWYWGSDPDAKIDVAINGVSNPFLVGLTPSYTQFSFTFGITATGHDTVNVGVTLGLGEAVLLDNFSLAPEVTPSPSVPESSTWALMLLGLAGLGLARAFFRGSPRRRPA